MVGVRGALLHTDFRKSQCCIISAVHTLHVIYWRLTPDVLQKKFQHGEYITCDPSISQPIFIFIFIRVLPSILNFHKLS